MTRMSRGEPDWVGFGCVFSSPPGHREPTIMLGGGFRAERLRVNLRLVINRLKLLEKKKSESKSNEKPFGFGGLVLRLSHRAIIECHLGGLLPLMTIHLFLFANLKWSWACSKGEEGDCRLPVSGKGWAGEDPCGAHHQRGLPGRSHGDPGALLWLAAGSLRPHSVHEVSNLPGVRYSLLKVLLMEITWVICC